MHTLTSNYNYIDLDLYNLGNPLTTQRQASHMKKYCKLFDLGLVSMIVDIESYN